MWEDRIEEMAIGKTKLDAERAPTFTDDTQQGYRIGSEWFDVLNKRQYVCLDSQANTAVWVETTRAVAGVDSTPSSGNHKVTSIEVLPGGKLKVDYEETPE